TPQQVKSVFAQYDVAKDPQFAGKNALVLGKLYRRNGEWRFAAIGDAYDDNYDLRNTIDRIMKNYAK
ncbi:MAG: TerD family protein, partial [Muribaculaceae bacterium]|nr:TerD family protein [Muribaculaceae bacterium]